MMERRPAALVAAAFAGLAAWVGGPPVVADAAGGPTSFGETVDVRLVNVEVVVTDSDGRPLTGLGAADFVLRVDGREVVPEFWSEVREGRVAAGTLRAAPGPAPGEESGEPRASDRVPTSTLIFVDDVFSMGHHRDRVLTRIRAQVASLPPGDRVAVVSFDGASLAMHAGWTADPTAVAAALDRATRGPARGIWRLVERNRLRDSRLLVSAADEAPSGGRPAALGTSGGGDPFGGRSGISTFGGAGGFGSRLDFEEKSFGLEMADRIDAVVEAAASAMRTLAAAPGRKVVLLLSGGWPFSLDAYIRAGRESGLGRELPEGRELFGPLTAAANRWGYTVYPIDVPGVQGEMADAGGSGPASMDGWHREQEVEGSLAWIAAETGGRALLNGLREDAWRLAAADTRAYYWLGFTPGYRRDGQRHEVRVTLRDPDLRRRATVRARRDYLDLSRDDEVEMLLDGALLMGGLPGAAPLPIEVGRPRRAGGGEIEWPLRLGLPVDAMTVIPDGDRFTARLELRIAGATRDGRRGETPVLTLTLTGDRAPRPGGFVAYETSVTVRGRARRLVLATYDPWSGKVATGSVDLGAAARGEAAPPAPPARPRP